MGDAPNVPLTADDAALRWAFTEVVLQALKQMLGPDNVDRIVDDEFRIGVSLGNGSWFAVEVVPREVEL